MSEEVKEEVPEAVAKPKQYLLMIDELSLVFLSKIIPSIQFCEVEGVSVDNNTSYQLLVNPTRKVSTE